MRKISDTITRLTALRRQLIPGQDNSPSDHLQELVDFGSNPGGLRSRYYLPDDFSEGAPLVVVLHGCTQTAAGYDRGSGWSQLADEAGFALLFPEQQRHNNANLCFNWFEPGDAKRHSGEALSIFQMIETLAATHGLDRQRIFITGLSAGGAMAGVMLAAYPEVFAGGAIIAGLPYGSAKTIPEAFDRMRGHGLPPERQLQSLVRDASQHAGPWPRLSVWHGTADLTVAPVNADAIVGQWRGVHGVDDQPTRSETVDGHTRHIWTDAQGAELIEAYSIARIGHGTPLKTQGVDGLGSPAPFMLEAGISSTQRIAQFWEIAPAEPSHMSKQAWKNGPDRDSSRRGVEVKHASLSQAAASGIRKTIEDALRSAGLLR